MNPNSFVAPSVGAAGLQRQADQGPRMEYLGTEVSAVQNGHHRFVCRELGRRADCRQLSLNEVPPGLYTNLQAAKPYSAFGTIDLYENTGHNWYNSAQLKLERRFCTGPLLHAVVCIFEEYVRKRSRRCLGRPTPFAPEGYNRGLASFDHANILVRQRRLGRSDRKRPCLRRQYESDC